MKILLTGGTGTISSGIAQASVDAGYETYAITRGNNVERNIKGVKYLYGDLWNESITDTIMDCKYDVVIECLVYTLEQLKMSLRNFGDKCNQYVFISTAGVYSCDIADRRIREDDEKNLIEWGYTRNKIECEKYLIEFCKKSSLKYTIVRPTVTYGNYRIPFPIATRNPGWTFFQRMIDRRPMLASDNVKFSVIHIDDFSKYVVALFGNKQAYNEDFHVVDSKNDIYWDDILRISGEILGVECKAIHVSDTVIKEIYPSIYDELRFNKNRSLLLDDHKIKMVTGIESRIDIREGMERIINAMKDEYTQINKLDDIWNSNCDITIYHAFRKHKIGGNEKEYAKAYIDEKFSMEYRIKYYKTRVKIKVKSICK